MGCRGLAIGVAFGSLAISSSALAQDARRMVVELRGEVEHDSNVTRSSDAQAALRGLSQEDTTFTPSLAVDLAMPIGQQAVFLKGYAGYTFYDRNTRLDRERIDLTGGTNLSLGPCTSTLSGSYGRGLRQLEDPLLITTVENIQELKRIGLSAACARQTGFGVNASVSKDWVDNDLAILNESDYDTTSFSGGISYSRPALGSLTLFATRQKTDYPNRLFGGGYTMDSVGLKYERRLGARIEGAVSVARGNIDSNPVLGFDPGDTRTTTYSADLSYRVSSRLRMSAGAARSVSPTASLGRAYDENTSYRLTANYDMGSRISLGLGGAYIERDAKGVLQVDQALLSSSTTKTVFGSVRYRHSDRLQLILNASQEERSANLPQFNYTSTRVGLTGVATF